MSFIFSRTLMSIFLIFAIFFCFFNRAAIPSPTGFFGAFFGFSLRFRALLL